MVRLGDICIQITDGSHNPPMGVEQSNYLMLSSKNIDDDHITFNDPRYLSQEDFEAENKRTNIKPNDLLITIVGTIGRVAIVPNSLTEFCVQRSVAVLKPKPEMVYNRFLMYYLQNMRPYLEQESRGVAQKGIYLKQLSNLSIILPPLDEQRKIAAVLDKVSDLIAKRRQQLDKLDELIKARFVEMFGDEHHLDDWNCVSVGEVADICVGVVIKPTQYYTDQGGVPAFRSLNIGAMTIKNADWVYFTKEGHEKNKKSIVCENDVLVVRSGAPGTACVVTKEFSGYNAVDIIIAHPNIEKINSVFLAMFTNMPHGMNQIREKTGGAAQQHFNVGGYKELTVILPPIELQNQFAAFVEQTEKTKTTISESLQQLETLKKALMQEYFG